MKNLNIFLKGTLIGVILMLQTGFVSAQEKEEKDKRPVTEVFNSTTLIDNQTSVIPYKKGLQYNISHRFGKFENGIKDLYGIYAPSNIKMGLDYGLGEKLMIGFATEKNNKAQEFFWKYNIVEQTRSNSMPVTITYFGNMALDGSDETDFGAEYKFIHRMSYFTQFIISRKFSDRVSFLIAPGFSHFNIADSIFQNQRITFTAGGKINVYNNISLLVEYDNSFSLNELEDYQKDNDPEGNLGFAAEILSGTHTFQITLSQFRELVGQYNHAYNSNSLKDGWVIGFNVNVRFY